MMSIPSILKRADQSRRWASTRGLTSMLDRDNALVYNGVAYPFRWLRDSCQCAECIHPSNKQKLHRTTDIPADIRPSPGGIYHTNAGVDITWSSGHKSSFSSSFLQTYASPTELHKFHRDVDPVTWDKASLERSVGQFFVSYEDLQSPSGLLAGITQLTRYGLLFVTGVPHSETSDEKCETRRLAQMFGEIRNTFYGEVWDVINVRNSINIAYTNLFLGLHMDLVYVSLSAGEGVRLTLFLCKALPPSATFSTAALSAQPRARRRIHIL